MILRIAMVLGLIGMAGIAQAACPGESQGEANICAAAAAKTADADLNAAYRRLDPTPDLKAAQRSWLRFRDAQCGYEAGVYAGGSIQPMVYSRCIADVTSRRAAELKALAEFEEYRARGR